MSAHGQAGRQERQARGVQVHDDATSQSQDGDDREGDEEPRGQDRGQGADGVGVDGLAELGVGAHQEDAEEDEHHAGQCRSQRGPADDAGCRGLAGQVAGVVGGGIDPTEAEAGGHHDQGSDEGRRAARRQGQDLVDTDLGSDEDEVDDGEDTGGPGDPGLNPHDRLEAENTGAGSQANSEQEAQDLGTDLVVPTQGLEHRGRGQGGRDAQDGLPADREDPGQGRGQAIAVVAEGRSGQRQGGGAASFAQDGHDTAQQEGDDDANAARNDRLPEGQSESEDPGTPGQSQDGDVGREPGHEEIARPPLAIRLGDDVKTGVLDASGGGNVHRCTAHGRSTSVSVSERSRMRAD